MLLNLLTNAIKYSRKGTILVNSYVIKDGKKFYLRVSVADRGIGISTEEVKKIFIPFGLLENEKTTPHSGNSHGIGLSVCK